MRAALTVPGAAQTMGHVSADDLNDDDALHTFFARSLTDLEGKSGLGVITVAAPVAPLEAFLRATPREMSMLWHPPNGATFAATGAAVVLNFEGPSRLRDLREKTSALFDSLRVYVQPDIAPPPPRLFGGVSFAPGFSGVPWEGFPDASLAMGRWVYARSADMKSAFLSFATPADADLSIRARLGMMEELDSILEALSSAAGTTAAAPPARSILSTSIAQLDLATWTRHIDAIRAAIGSDRFEKIVAARRGDVTLEDPIDDVDVVTRLAAEPGCIRFSFRRGNATFLGASPETLFTKLGVELVTEALAGTIKSLGSDVPRLEGQSTRLLNSEKDLSEHAFVVREIRESLAPLAKEIIAHKHPQIRKVRNILHLNTAISATLQPQTHVIDILMALHPTPAVGGAPTREAAEWIAAHEIAPRGWYTGTVGWVDAKGDGSFAVAIRAGVLRDKMAFVFTGAGIVLNSDAGAEYAETSLKQGPFLRALGVEPRPSEYPGR